MTAFIFTSVLSLFCRIQFLYNITPYCHHHDDHPPILPTLAPNPTPPTTTPTGSPGNNKYDPDQPLNILVLFGDDWRYNSIGIMNPTIQTPTLDALAHNGIHFINSYVTTSVCWVSRATYFTGQYMSRHLTTRVVDPKFYNTWNTTAWPALLQQSSSQYYVGHIGKWQFQNPNRFVESAFNFTSIFENHVDARTGIRATERTVNDTIRFLTAYEQMNHQQQQLNNDNKTNKKHPFALTVAMFPPKSVMDGTIPSQNYMSRDLEYDIYKNISIPIVANNINDASYKKLPYFLQSQSPLTESRRRYEQKYIPNASFQENMQRYYALITEVDTALLQIINVLKERNLYDQTVILFTTDNGYMHGEHGLSGKWYPFQESIRVPFILSDPRMSMTDRNTTNTQFVLNVDIAPTLLSIANVTTTRSTSTTPIQPQQQHQGMDITQLYLNNTNNNNNNNQSNDSTNTTTTTPSTWRSDEYYYEHPTIGSRTFLTSSTAIVSKQFSYMIYPEWNNYEVLHDLQNDPLEQTNIVNHTDYTIILEYYRQRHAVLKEMVK